MTSLSSQLSRLVPKLYGKECAILVLRNFKATKLQDQGLVKGLGPGDLQEYNRLIRLLTVCNTELVIAMTLIEQLIDKLDLRLAWLMSLARLSPAKAERFADTGFSWTRLAESLAQGIIEDLKGHWGELRALEIALDEVAQEFDGEDVLKPIIRQDIERAKAKALEVYRIIQAWDGEFELPEADPEAVQRTLELIDRWAENRRL